MISSTTSGVETEWVFNVDCVAPPKNTPVYYDKLIIPSIFYDAVISKNVDQTINIIKYNPRLSTSIVQFYNLVLQQAFYFKKAAKAGAPYKIQWATNTQNGGIIINFNEQSELYKYIANSQPLFTNMGFLVNTINSYLVQLRLAMTYINNKYPACQFYKLGINITNNAQMKLFIARYIPNYNF